MPNSPKSKIPPTKILVLVHPGSACGSTDMSLGLSTGAAERQGLIQDLNSQSPQALVILEGLFNNELSWPKYLDLGQAITSLTTRTKDAGGQVFRRTAPDPTQMLVIRRLVSEQKWHPSHITFDLTGAWTNSEDPGSGCVNSVALALRKMGFTATIRDSAVDEVANGQRDWLDTLEAKPKTSSRKLR